MIVCIWSGSLRETWVCSTEGIEEGRPAALLEWGLLALLFGDRPAAVCPADPRRLGRKR